MSLLADRHRTEGVHQQRRARINLCTLEKPLQRPGTQLGGLAPRAACMSSTARVLITGP